MIIDERHERGDYQKKLNQQTTDTIRHSRKMNSDERYHLGK